MSALADKKAFRSLPSPKRGSTEKSGLHAWHPYYAGYSELFVADVLNKLVPHPDSIVLDPMNGSGTTTLVAQQCSIPSLGVELNPVMAIISRAKNAAFCCHRKTITDDLTRVIRSAKRRAPPPIASDHATAWIPQPALANLMRLDAAIAALPSVALLPLHPRLADILPTAERHGGTADLLRAALLIVARRASSAEQSKNPTWLRPGSLADAATMDVYQLYRATVLSMLDDLDASFPRPPSHQLVSIIEGDARLLPCPDRSVDIIVTSPPYLTRIDYAVGTAPELVLLGYHSDNQLRTLRRSIMGSTCITTPDTIAERSWGRTCTSTLAGIRRHPSKASAGYYLKTHVQYFRDAEALLQQCLRVLRRGGAAVFVVQDSWYKDVHVPLGRIYAEMATRLGASARIAYSELVRSHLGLVNTRARRYTKGALHEHVVLIRRR